MSDKVSQWMDVCFRQGIDISRKGSKMLDMTYLIEGFTFTTFTSLKKDVYI